MKQRAIRVLVCMLLTLAISSCGKRNLVGVWECDKSYIGKGITEVWRFGEDGSFINLYECEKSQLYSWEFPKVLARGSYKVFGNKITLHYTGGGKEKWSYSLNNSKKELRIGKDVSGYDTFQRVR